MASNRQIIINLIKENTILTKPQIAEIMEVSLTTTNKYVNELVKEGIVIEDIVDRVKTEGKPPIFYKINSEHKNLVGVYLSSNKIEIIITDSLGNEQNRFSTPIKNNNEITKEILHSEIASVIKKYDLKDKIKMISIGIPGVLDENNYIADIPTLPKLDKINLKKFLTEKLELPVIIENDVNLTVKALHTEEEYKQYRNLVYFFIKNGIGGGIITAETLYKGSSNFSGEFAYLALDEEYMTKYKIISPENLEKYFIEKLTSNDKIRFMLFIILRIISTLNPEVIIFETDYLKKSDIETLNKKLESFLGESHIPEITLITNNDLGINGTITNALEAFYSED